MVSMSAYSLKAKNLTVQDQVGANNTKVVGSIPGQDHFLWSGCGSLVKTVF